MMQKKPVYSVSSINQYIKSLFMDDYALNHIYVRGEVSNCKYHPSGHIYFTLKDQGGSIACVMFASARKGLAFKMTEGMSVIVYGSVSVYERDGRYQLYAREITKEGAGKLYEAYEALKKKLAEEGLFDQSHKKAIPAFPVRLGIVTARTGAALQDILNVSLRRYPALEIVFCPAIVQGESAAQSIAAGIRAVDQQQVDVMIVGRGGGSIEDLWAFNEEIVARAVYEAKTPVISAVGHETDVTIIDFVADLRAPTPSAAAELAVPDMQYLLGQLAELDHRMNQAMKKRLKEQKDQLHHLERLLRHMNPEYRILELRQRLIDMETDLLKGMNQNLERQRQNLQMKAEKLEGLSPVRQLLRGYAYVTDDSQHAVTSIGQVEKGQQVHVAVADGTITTEVVFTEQVRRDW